MGGPISAVIFDTDGVVTKTTTAHLGAWKRLFDDFLRARAGGSSFEPFSDDDYRRYVDGIPRYDGVARFLASRGISIPRGSADDAPGDGTVCALGNLKNGYFIDHVRDRGVEAFPSTVRFVRQLLDAGIGTAVISASRNCEEVLRSAGVDHLFGVRVDGTDADELGLAGKPDPAIFLEAARRLGVDPTDAAIVEDAMLGVEAGRRGGFGLVIGVDRTGHPDGLQANADIVVPDLADLAVKGGGIEVLSPPAAWLPELASALEDDDVPRRLEGRRPAVFLDYDGTLTPIVARPELATLPPATLSVLEALAEHCIVAIISGRDLDDIKAMVPSDRLWFAGSHGLDVASPEGWRRDFEAARRLLGPLTAAQHELEEAVREIPEAWVERKRFAVAVHHRQTPEGHVARLEALVRDVAANHPGLRVTEGKKIFELRPDIPWDKGTALGWVLEAAGATGPEVLAVYIGDDVTDEDAFRAVRARGLGVVVGDEERTTAAHHRLRDPDEVRQFLMRLHRPLEDDHR